MQTTAYCLYDIKWENEGLLPNLLIIARHRKVGVNNMRDFLADKMKLGEAKNFGMIHLTGKLKNEIMSEVFNSDSLRKIWKASLEFHKGSRSEWEELKDREWPDNNENKPFSELLKNYGN